MLTLFLCPLFFKNEPSLLDGKSNRTEEQLFFHWFWNVIKGPQADGICCRVNIRVACDHNDRAVKAELSNAFEKINTGGSFEDNITDDEVK